MTGTQTLIARSALGLSAAILGYIAVFTRSFQLCAARTFNRAAVAAFALTRFGLFLLTFVAVRLAPRGDIPAYYVPEAESVLSGRLPYRDFGSSYAPLHPYLDAILIFFWRSPLPIILFAIVVELLLFSLWLRLARSFLPEQAARTAAILYLASPISLQYVAVDGQDNVLIALFLALAMLQLLRNRELLSGILLALGAVAVKFLPLLYVPAFFLTARRRMLWLAGLAAALLVGYGAFAWMRLPLLYPLRTEGSFESAGNLPYLVESLFGISSPPLLADAILLLPLLLLFALIATSLSGADPQRRMRILTFGSVALTAALVLFAKKSWPAYLMFALFPICLLFGEGRQQKIRVAVFSFFSVVAVTEHSFWASILDLPSASALHSSLGKGQPTALIFLMLQLLLLAGYAWLIAEAIPNMLRPRAGRDPVETGPQFA